jgi:hypothetical protein
MPSERDSLCGQGRISCSAECLHETSGGLAAPQFVTEL